MTPSGVLCRIFGAKNVLSVGLLGNAATMALLPLTVVRGVYPTSALLVIKGLCQSCLESTHTTLKRCWMPRCLGPERVWAVRVTRWGQFLGQMAASLITPWVASRFGWRAVPLSFGCVTGLYTLAWHAAFAETPLKWHGNMSASEKQLLLESDEMKVTAATAVGGAAGGAASQRDGGSFPFHLLRYPSCVVPMMLHVGNNCSQYTLQYWGPTMLADMFAASPQQQGNIIFAATLASVIGSFAVAGLENLMLVRQLLPSHMLLRRPPCAVRPWVSHMFTSCGRGVLQGRIGLSLLSVRRGCGSFGCILQSSCMLGFGMARSPPQAILAYSLHNLFQCVTVRLVCNSISALPRRNDPNSPAGFSSFSFRIRWTQACCRITSTSGRRTAAA